jgi:YegS/Rv2252/BmrU family lipid kinase
LSDPGKEPYGRSDRVDVIRKTISVRVRYTPDGPPVASWDAMRALVVVNPSAGRRTAGPHDLEEAVSILRASGFDIECAETAPEHPTSADLAKRAVDERFDACIVAGGDGTVAPAAAVLLETEVILGILPFGSFMNIAHGLGLPMRPVDAARTIARKRVRRADVGEVHGKLFFETAGVGLDAELFGAARNAERRSWRRALRRVWRWATHGTPRVAITIDGETHRHRVMQVLVLNSPYYAWALPLLPGASMLDGLLDVAVFPRMGRLALIASLVAVLRARRLSKKPVTYRGAKITMTCDDPITVHADGKIAGNLPAEFRCRAGALKVFL